MSQYISGSPWTCCVPVKHPRACTMSIELPEESAGPNTNVPSRSLEDGAWHSLSERSGWAPLLFCFSTPMLYAMLTFKMTSPVAQNDRLLNGQSRGCRTKRSSHRLACLIKLVCLSQALLTYIPFSPSSKPLALMSGVTAGSIKSDSAASREKSQTRFRTYC